MKPAPLAAFRGPVTCRRAANALVLTGAAADAADELIILTFIGPTPTDLPPSLAAALANATADSRADSPAAAAVAALPEDHYRITCGSGDWIVAATSVHLHRDIGKAFYGAIPPRHAPLTKRLFWRAVLGLAATRAGKRLLLSLRRRS